MGPAARVRRPRPRPGPDRRRRRPGSHVGVGPHVRRGLFHGALSRCPHLPPPVARRLVIGIRLGRRDDPQPRPVAVRPPRAVHEGRSVLGHGSGRRRRRRRVRGRRVVGGPPCVGVGRRRRGDARDARPGGDDRDATLHRPPTAHLSADALLGAAVADVGDRHRTGSCDPAARVRRLPHHPDPLHVPAPDRRAGARRARSVHRRHISGAAPSNAIDDRLAGARADARQLRCSRPATLASGRPTRWLLVGLAVAVVCWAQPLWDQVAGDRNLGAVLDQPRGR